MKNRKKAFTLTELLVVVIVIGVLSAVVLPKFSKVVETRKTTEAEEIMAAVRTEQEKRCALDKNYLTSMNDVKDIVGSSTSKNYQYSMEATGMLARSTGKYNYTLKMPSYRDGRICCENEEECNKLNKKYTPCSSLTKQPDYQVADSACAGEVEEVPTVLSCSGASTQTCGCNNAGTQTRTCNTTTGVWGDWSACSVAETCSCDAATKPSATQACNECGEQTREVTCNTATGSWTTGSWSECSKTEEQCKPDTCENREFLKAMCNGAEHSNDDGKLINMRWNDDTCDCECPASLNSCEEELFRKPDGSDVVLSGSLWNEATCSCISNPNKKHWFNCVDTMKSTGGLLMTMDSYDFQTAKALCESGADTSVTYMVMIKEGGEDPKCRKYQTDRGMTDCPMLPSYYTKYACEDHAPGFKGGYGGYDQKSCMKVAGAHGEDPATPF